MASQALIGVTELIWWCQESTVVDFVNPTLAYNWLYLTRVDYIRQVIQTADKKLSIIWLLPCTLPRSPNQRMPMNIQPRLHLYLAPLQHFSASRFKMRPRNASLIRARCSAGHKAGTSIPVSTVHASDADLVAGTIAV